MAERGFLIRTTLAAIWRSLIPGLRGRFAEFADEIETEGSDGIGRKTEAPWVRMFSKELSPNPREGFYIVVHFSADGGSIYITVGCGSTIWSGGDLKSISDEELKLRTDWARKVVVDKWSSLDPFTDAISLGAKASLPRTFEKATAFAKRFSADDLDESVLENTIAEAAERLAEIYRSQKSGRDITPGDEAAAEIESISKPLRSGRPGQGFGLKAPERKAIELQAMAKAEEWLVTQGYKVKDTHLNQSYDFIATKDGVELFVEVKGTISDFCNSILMTKNEVELHRSKKGTTALILVYRIRLERGGPEPKAFDGQLECFIGWDIDSWKNEPIAFQVSRSPVATP